MSDDEIKKHEIFGLTEFIFKHRKTARFKEFIKELVQWINNAEVVLDKPYINSLFIYITNTYENANSEALEKQLEHDLSDDLKDSIMTIANQFRNEGEKKGFLMGEQIGSNQAKKDIAKNMLKSGFKITDIKIITGLTEDTIKKLSEE